jgi:hypothetical protein
MKQPHVLVSDEAAVDALLNHRFFVPHKTPCNYSTGRRTRSCRRSGRTPIVSSNCSTKWV